MSQVTSWSAIDCCPPPGAVCIHHRPTRALRHARPLVWGRLSLACSPSSWAYSRHQPQLYSPSSGTCSQTLTVHLQSTSLLIRPTPIPSPGHSSDDQGLTCGLPLLMAGVDLLAASGLMGTLRRTDSETDLAGCSAVHDLRARRTGNNQGRLRLSGPQDEHNRYALPSACLLLHNYTPVVHDELLGQERPSAELHTSTPPHPSGSLRSCSVSDMF